MAIEGFRHKGLRQFFERADARGIPSEHARKIRRVLTLLNAIESPAEFGMFPGLRAHPLKGDLRAFGVSRSRAIDESSFASKKAVHSMSIFWTTTEDADRCL